MEETNNDMTTGRRYYNVFSNERVTLIRVLEGMKHQIVEYRRDNEVRVDTHVSLSVFRKPLYVWAICYRPLRDDVPSGGMIPVTKMSAFT